MAMVEMKVVMVINGEGVVVVVTVLVTAMVVVMVVVLVAG